MATHDSDKPQPLTGGEHSVVADGAPTGFAAWLRENAGSLIFSLVALVVVCVYLNPLDVLKVILGLGLVIFIHELGHFLAAKWCDVHVETFSIGFGPAVPGCRYRYGETTYMVGLIPLGGYVKMVGEGSEEEGGEDDPRSFKNKTVGQRMLIISAGVVMNMILAGLCFVFVYTARGVDEKAAIIGSVNPGSPAWQIGLKPGTLITKIGRTDNPYFDDVRPEVIHSRPGEPMPIAYRETPTSPVVETTITPVLNRDESLWPVIGVANSPQLTLLKSRLYPVPYRSQSAAAAATPPLQSGDRIVGMTDPQKPGEVTPLPPAPWRPEGSDQRDYFAYLRRLRDLAGQSVTLRVERREPDGQVKTFDSVVPPAYQRTLGMRFAMGPVVAVRDDSPAQRAGIKPSERHNGSLEHGDVITLVQLETGGEPIRLFDVLPKDAKANDRVLDPVHLPDELSRWAASQRQRLGPDSTTWPKIKLTVLRNANHTQKPAEVEIAWDDRWHDVQESAQSHQNTPISIPALGLAYRVLTTLADVYPGTPAEAAGLRRMDVIREVQFFDVNPKTGVEEPLSRRKLNADQAAWMFASLQIAGSNKVRVRVEREGKPLTDAAGNAVLELTAIDDKAWPTTDLGFFFESDIRLKRANSLLEALEMGWQRTVRTVQVIYQNLWAMIMGRISPQSISGPITIARTSYRIAGEDLFQFILFLGMINVNLAVINFLPIPVLDGGHMVFLIYEKLRGKPPSDWVRGVATFIGIALILSLMVFVIYLDVTRLF